MTRCACVHLDAENLHEAITLVETAQDALAKEGLLPATSFLNSARRALRDWRLLEDSPRRAPHRRRKLSTRAEGGSADTCHHPHVTPHELHEITTLVELAQYVLNQHDVPNAANYLRLAITGLLSWRDRVTPTPIPPAPHPRATR